MNASFHANILHRLRIALLVAASFVLAFFFPAVGYAATFISLPTNAEWSETWTKDGSPYILDGNGFIRFGSLSVEPGVVIKFTPGSSLTLHADVAVSMEGTTEEPIYVTSLKDDSVGGDANEDGTVTTPAPGDWGFLSLGSGSRNDSLSIGNVHVLYGGGTSFLFGGIFNGVTVAPALMLEYQWFQGFPGQSYAIESISISHSAGEGLFIHVGQANSVSITQSRFHDNASFGVRKYELFGRVDETGSLNPAHNWWGSGTGPYDALLNPSGEGDHVRGTKLTIEPWLSEDSFPNPASTLPTPESPPSAFTSFTLNGAEADAEISPEAPSVEITVSAPAEARFTRLYVCPEAADPCDGSSDIKFFSPNATTTSFTRSWEGLAASDEPAPPGVYQLTARFFRYSVQSEAFEETAPYTITVLGGDEGNEEDTANNPLPALSTFQWTPFTEDLETGERTYGEAVVFADGAEETVPFNTPGEFSIEIDGMPFFGLEATLFYIPDTDSPTREFVASLGGFAGPFELIWSTPGVYELDIYTSDPILETRRVPIWHRVFGWLVGYEARATEHANLIDRIRFTVTEEVELPPEPEYAACCSSVIFLPGFEGSRLRVGNNELWPPTPLDVTNDLAALRLDDSGNSVTADVLVDGIMNTFLTSPVYEEFTAFMDTLVAVDGTTGTSTIKSWLPLAYDWRFAPERIIENSIATPTGTIDVLQTIEQLALDSDTGQVTIVAHSNGGLLGKAIIKALQDAGKEELIDSFVMVGSPQLGTPQAVGGLLHGEGSQLGNWLYTSVTKAQARVLGSNMESAYNLLPSREYFTDVTDPLALFDEDAGYADSWRALWGQAIGNYTELFEFLTDAQSTRDVPGEDDTDSPTELDHAILSHADAFHQTYDTYTIPDSIRVVQVAGWGAETIKRLDYLATELYRPFQTPNGRPYYTVQRTIEGDGVVVYPSALSSEGERYYFNHESYGRNLKHKDLLRIDQIQNVLSAVINERPVELTEFISNIKPTATEVSNRLLIAVHSPLTLGVYDSEGNFTGIDPANDSNWEIKFVKNDIPNSSYFEYGESKYLTVPEGGSYSFVFEGTDTGTATIVLETITADTSTTTATYSNIPVTSATLAQFTFGTDSEEPEISLDEDGDGTADTTILSDEKTLKLQAQANQEAPSVETVPPPPPLGGGGPLWNSPTPPIPPLPLVLGTSTEVITESLPIIQPQSDNTPLSELVSVLPSILEPVPETLTQEYDNLPQTPEPVEQTATAARSWWYDVFVKFVRDSFVSLTAFLRALF